MADQRADHRRKLEEMKKVLVTDEDFGRVYRIFFDEVACHRSFMALGKKEKSPLLKTTLRLVGESLFGVPCEVTGLFLFRLKQEKFIHGCCNLNLHPATIIYFEDIDMGMSAIIRDMRTSMMTYSRITTTVVKDSGKAGNLVSGGISRH